MFCSHCGREIDKTAGFCPNCGRSTLPQTAESQRTSIPILPSTALSSGRLSAKAIASLICGFFFFIPLADVAAIVLGHVALSEIRKSGGRIDGRGVALAGLIIGYAEVFFTIVLVLSVTMIPRFTRPRPTASEAAVIASLKKIDESAHAYGAVCPGGFPETLADLAPHSAASRACPKFTDFLDPALAHGFQQGYIFSYVPQMNYRKGKRDGYIAGADPLRVSLPVRRHFFVDQTGVIRFELNKAATKSSPPLR